MNKKIYFSLFIGTSISIATLYLAFRNVPLPELAAYLSSIDYFWILPTAFLVLCGFALRAIRWRYILSSTQPVKFFSAYHPLIIGFMVNCVLPGRVGEFARPLILNHKTKIPVTTGLATVIVERVFDLIILLALFMLVSNQIHIDAAREIEFSGYRIDGHALQSIFKGMLVASAILIIFTILISLEKTRIILNRLVLALPTLLFTAGGRFKRKFARRVCIPIARSIANISDGMALMKNPLRTVVCLIISMGIWVVAALSYYVFSIGCPAIHLNPLEMTAVMIVICFVIALPSVPGFWGLWEAGGVFALAFFGVSEKDAAGFTLANHAVQIIPVILAGLLSAWISGVNIVKVSYRKEEVTP